MIEYELSESLEGRIHEEFGEARFFHGGFKPKGPKMYKSWFGGIKTPYKPVNYSKPNTGFAPFSGSRNTAYAPLSHDKTFNIGITHHDNGLGKLKIFDNMNKKSYGIPLIDIHKKPLKKWRY